jgi:FkbM family methyltransferase
LKIFNRLLQRADFDGLHEPRLLNEFFGKGSFTFVDVGANYPETSLSTPLEMAGWSGAVIEPQPSCINMLRKYRKCKIVQCACSSYDNQNKKMKLWVAGPLSSLNLEFISPKDRPKKFIYVDIKTLDQILVENHIQSIDLLAIDAEGAEIDVLNGLDFKKFPPKLILIEDHARDFVKHHFLKKKGYKLFRRTGYNAWYAKEKYALPVSLIGRLQLWIKYYVGGPLRNFRRWRHQHSLSFF